MEQQIRFCTTSDGVRIAYATVGQGPPLVSVSGWVSHLGLDWNHPDVRPFFEGLAKGRLLVRYDKRGTGLSDWDAQDFSMEARMRDLGAVVDALGLDRFALMGLSEGGPTALVYASRNPERVTRLVLYGSFHRWPHSREVMEPILALIRAQWGMASAALSAAFVPSADPAQVASFTEMERVSASAETAARILEVNMGLDLTPLLKGIRAPTLVIHRRGDTIAPFKVGREMAALIPGARFEPLEGEHMPVYGDSKAILNAIDAFLGEEGEQAAAQVAPAGLVTILFTDMEGSTTLTQRLGDARAQEVLREHNAIIREALKAHAGSEIKHTGDGVMASFPTASGALECAIAVQQGFAERNSGVGARGQAPLPEPIRVRIGLNAGEPVAEEEDLFGTAVQLAARVCAQAEPGRILVPEGVRHLVAGKGFLFSDRGDVALRGFEDPVRLYELRWEPESAEGQA
jgi:class 3 adenylate cyclase/pimeloyl-ACP methyl ester carboxylesterase